MSYDYTGYNCLCGYRVCIVVANVSNKEREDTKNIFARQSIIDENLVVPKLVKIENIDFLNQKALSMYYIK